MLISKSFIGRSRSIVTDSIWQIILSPNKAKSISILDSEPFSFLQLNPKSLFSYVFQFEH